MATQHPLQYLGAELHKGETETVALAEAVDNAPVVCVYFSAHWCPPCKAFTPVLAAFYEEANEDEKQVEIVFVSCDRNEAEFKSYYSEMPWLAAKFDKTQLQNIQANHIPFSGIPYLVVLNKDGTVKHTTGRADVSQKGTAAIADWKK